MLIIWPCKNQVMQCILGVFPVCFKDMQCHLSPKQQSWSTVAVLTLPLQISQGLFSVSGASAGHGLHPNN